MEGGFPIEIEIKISKLITNSLAIFIIRTKISKLYVISLLIRVSISIGNPPYILHTGLIISKIIL